MVLSFKMEAGGREAVKDHDFLQRVFTPECFRVVLHGSLTLSQDLLEAKTNLRTTCRKEQQQCSYVASSYRNAAIYRIREEGGNLASRSVASAVVVSPTPPTCSLVAASLKTDLKLVWRYWL